VVFVAVAGRAGLDVTSERAPTLFSDNLMWGLDDSIWDLYDIVGQPATVLIKDGSIVDSWYGVLEESQLREKLDELAS
jgi:hypothetical protein